MRLRRLLLRLYVLDGQSHPSRRRCHCWKLHDQQFAFCERFGAACNYEQGIQHTLDRFSAAWYQSEMKITANKTDVLICIISLPRQLYRHSPITMLQGSSSVIKTRHSNIKTSRWLELANQWLKVSWLWLDSDTTRRNFRRLCLEGLVTLIRQIWLGHVTAWLRLEKLITFWLYFICWKNMLPLVDGLMRWVGNVQNRIWKAYATLVITSAV